MEVPIWLIFRLLYIDIAEPESQTTANGKKTEKISKIFTKWY